jgi:large subunit ribosomal protein L5
MADETTTTDEQVKAPPGEALEAPAAATPAGAPSPPARVLERYRDDVLPKLQEEFNYSSPMQLPTISKVTLSMGLGEAKQDRKILEAAMDQLGIISGQKPAVRRARKSIAQFKLRDGMPVGAVVTLRRAHMWEFLDRLMAVALPRIRDFRGINPDSFDGRGNYNLGLREQTIFPEIDYDSIDAVRGLNVTITTTAQTDAEGRALLTHLGMPFREQGYTAEERAARRRRKLRGRSRN